MYSFHTMSLEEIAQVLPLGLNLVEYFNKGFVNEGSFLSAVIENDFVTAAHKADFINLEFLGGYVIMIAKWAPAGSLALQKRT